MASLILAVRFLTIVPVPGLERQWPGGLGSAAWWFPVVGLALGGVLAIADRLLALVFDPWLSAVLTVCLWTAVTGGLHLDGLADCLDGLGGCTPERRLAIMRDSHIGVFGALGLIASFALAVAALGGTPAVSRGGVLLLAPAVGRVAPLLAALGVRPALSGLGAAFVRSSPRTAGVVHLALVLLLALAVLGGTGVAIAVAALALSFVASAFFAGRLGGLTGDVLGAAVALSEIVFLIGGAAATRGTAG